MVGFLSHGETILPAGSHIDDPSAQALPNLHLCWPDLDLVISQQYITTAMILEAVPDANMENGCRDKNTSLARLLPVLYYAFNSYNIDLRMMQTMCVFLGII